MSANESKGQSILEEYQQNIEPAIDLERQKIKDKYWKE